VSPGPPPPLANASGHKSRSREALSELRTNILANAGGASGSGSGESCGSGSPVAGGGAGTPVDPKRSRRFLNQWRQAASVSKLGNRTRNLLGKWKATHSQSVDICGGHAVGGHQHPFNTSADLPGVAGAVGSDPCVAAGGSVDLSEDAAGGGGGPTAGAPAKKRWSEHVWSE